jgi:hypothetical protein
LIVRYELKLIYALQECWLFSLHIHPLPLLSHLLLVLIRRGGIFHLLQFGVELHLRLDLLLQQFLVGLLEDGHELAQLIEH